MFGQFSRKQESNWSLNFSRGDRLPLVVVSKSRRFSSDSFEDVVHEGVHDAHRSARNTNVGMNLLQNLVDVATIALLPRSPSFHDLRSSLTTFSAFLRTFLSRTLPGTLHRRRLTTGTHFPWKTLSQIRCELRAMTTGNEASERRTSIYVLGSDRKTFDGSRSRSDSNVFFGALNRLDQSERVSDSRSIQRVVSIRFRTSFNFVSSWTNSNQLQLLTNFWNIERASILLVVGPIRTNSNY